jgi:hypothetical protein
MDERILSLRTPDECTKFARNAVRLGRPDLAEEALVRSIQLKAEEYGADTSAEKEALQAVYAYEEVLSKKNGKRTTASRTWQMIRRHGIIEGVERAVNRDDVTQDYTDLVEMGLGEHAFESVILRHPAEFSEAAVEKSKQRLTEWKTA